MADEVFTYRAFLNKVKHHLMNGMQIEQLFIEKTQNNRQMEVMYSNSGNVTLFLKRLEVLAQMEEAGLGVDSCDFVSLGG